MLLLHALSGEPAHRHSPHSPHQSLGDSTRTKEKPRKTQATIYLLAQGFRRRSPPMQGRGVAAHSFSFCVNSLDNKEGSFRIANPDTQCCWIANPAELVRLTLFSVFSVFLNCAAKPQAVLRCRARTDKLACTRLGRQLRTGAHGAQQHRSGFSWFSFKGVQTSELVGLLVVVGAKVYAQFNRINSCHIYNGLTNSLRRLSLYPIAALSLQYPCPNVSIPVP